MRTCTGRRASDVITLSFIKGVFTFCLSVQQEITTKHQIISSSHTHEAPKEHRLPVLT